MPDIHFDRYYRYDDLTRLLHAYAAEYPDLVQVESIGQSFEGRAIWLATVTNTATSPAGEKPALWIGGNIHAGEVSPPSACRYSFIGGSTATTTTLPYPRRRTASPPNLPARASDEK